MKKLRLISLILGLLISSSFALKAQVLLEENFAGTDGDTLASGWGTHSLSTYKSHYKTGSLSYLNYASNSDNSAYLSSGQDYNKIFTATAITSGNLYCAMLVNIDSAKATGDYFFHTYRTSGSTSYFNRIYVRKVVTGNLQFGILKGTTGANVVWSDSIYTTGTTNLLVLKLEIVSGLTNDIPSLIINPTITGTEPVATITATDITSADYTYIDRIALRQGSTGAAPGLTIDGIRVATTWADIANIATISSDATLSNLTSGGTTVAGFAASTITYNVVLPSGTTVVPAVTATTTSTSATYLITPAASLPGATTVVVTAQDGTTQITYTINYTVNSNTIATLSNLTTGGSTVAGFASATYTYNVVLPYGTSTVPTVTATTTDANATYLITPAASLPGSTTVVVTAANGTSTQTYTINYTITPAATIATLSNLTTGGSTVAGFASTTYTYNVVLPYGTSTAPTVTATTTDANATYLITPAASLPGATTVLVTAQNGTTQQTYTINYTITPASTVATLSNLTTSGSTVAGFASTTYTYNVVLPYGTSTVPTVTATTTDANATYVITAATSLPGATTVLVTAQNGTTQNTYTVNYTLAPNTNATLSNLTSGGTTVTGFNATTYSYNVVLPAGTTVVPTATATTTDANATYVITAATSLPGATTVVVTAQDGSTQQTYTINYTVAVQTYSVTFSVVGTNGTLAATVDAAAITSPATVNAGKNVVFTASPAANYSVKEWKLDGTVISGNITNTYSLINLAANSTVTVEFKLNVGVNEATENVVSVYPNPANNVVNVKMNTTINKIAIVNINGQVVLESAINNIEGSINTSSIATGMYFLRIETANGITINKIQIVK